MQIRDILNKRLSLKEIESYIETFKDYGEFWIYFRNSLALQQVPESFLEKYLSYLDKYEIGLLLEDYVKFFITPKFASKIVKSDSYKFIELYWKLPFDEYKSYVKNFLKKDQGDILVHDYEDYFSFNKISENEVDMFFEELLEDIECAPRNLDLMMYYYFMNNFVTEKFTKKWLGIIYDYIEEDSITCYRNVLCYQKFSERYFIELIDKFQNLSDFLSNIIKENPYIDQGLKNRLCNLIKVQGA